MKRLIWMIPVIVVFCAATARAQETPMWEISGGYSYLDANLNGSTFHLHGGGGSLTQNMNSWFGGRLEANAYHGNDYGLIVSAQTVTFGPVFTYRKFQRIVPFGHVQVGVQHGSVGYLNGVSLPNGISAAASKFAIAPGGGFDFVVNRQLAIRAEGEYLLTRFVSERQDNMSVSLGFVFRFGKH